MAGEANPYPRVQVIIVPQSLSCHKSKERLFMSLQKHSGWVYVARADNDLYKIGQCRRSLDQRIKGVSYASPIPIQLILSIDSDDCKTLEREMHLKFASKRSHGEWFALNSSDIEAIKKEYTNG
jgi:hypothetical protein